jgi:type I site-specific restriction endonuclease
MRTIFRKYLKDLSDVSLRWVDREESFYPTLAGLFQQVSEATGRTHVHVTTLPKPREAGNPDFRLWNGTDRILGCIEAKRPTEERLDLIESTDQLQGYRSTFPNLILTNFLEFRRYRNGEQVETVLCGRPVVVNKPGTDPLICTMGM